MEHFLNRGWVTSTWCARDDFCETISKGLYNSQQYWDLKFIILKKNDRPQPIMNLRNIHSQCPTFFWGKSSILKAAWHSTQKLEGQKIQFLLDVIFEWHITTQIISTSFLITIIDMLMKKISSKRQKDVLP